MKKILFVGTVLVMLLAMGCISNAPTPSDQELGCHATGGVVVNTSCCLSADNFPNQCVIGACGCSYANSHSVKNCDCGQNKCFDGTKCVAVK